MASSVGRRRIAMVWMRPLELAFCLATPIFARNEDAAQNIDATKTGPRQSAAMTSSDQFVKYSQCDELHNVMDIERSFRLPDAYFALSYEERSARGKPSDDFRQLNSRYFIRSVAPIPVLDREGVYC